MDQVLGKEHTTDPPIIICTIADNPIIEGTTAKSTLEPSSSSSGDDIESITSSSSFNSGQRIKGKRKNDSDCKSDEIIDLMTQGLEQRKKEAESTDALLLRADEREEKLVSIMELLVKHIVKQ
jgi:hypothetical protein